VIDCGKCRRQVPAPELKHTPGAGCITALGAWLLWVAVLLPAWPAGYAGTLPGPADVNALAEAATSVWSQFRSEAGQLRFQYEYSGRFLDPADKRKLQSLAARASQELEKIGASQRRLKSRIEEYQGDDWDRRYGSTGLWRRLFADLYATSVSKVEVDFHIVLCADGEARRKALHGILEQIDSLTRDYDTARLDFLRALAFAHLAREDPAYEALARRGFDALASRSDVQPAIALRAAIESIRLFGDDRPDQRDRLAEALLRSKTNEPELILSLACLEHQLGRPQAFEKIVNGRGAVENFMGVLVLRDLAYRLAHNELELGRVSVFEAELAAQAAWGDVPEDWAGLLRRFCESRRFRRPLILYVTAVALAATAPDDSADLLIEAAKLQEEQNSARLGLGPAKIAEQAERLICESYAVGRSDPNAVLRVFGRCVQIAGGPDDRNLEYCYAGALIRAGRRQQGRELLTKIARSPDAALRHRAKLDLIEAGLAEYQTGKRGKDGLSAELLELLGDCTWQDDPGVRSRALAVYCEMLLRDPDRAEARKVLELLSDSELQNAPNLNLYRSSALRQLDRLEEAVACLAPVSPADERAYAVEAGALLAAVLDEIERLQANCADPARLLADTLAVARRCRRVSRSRPELVDPCRVGLYLAELSILQAVEDRAALSRIGAQLAGLAAAGGDDDVDFLRSRARLLAARGDFAAAAALWARVAQLHRKPSVNRQDASWWRAKFYELDCWAKAPDSPRKDILHAIEVLRSSFAEIPPFWAEKLDALSRRLSQG